MAALENSHLGTRISSLDSIFANQNHTIPSLSPLSGARKSSLPKGCRFRDFGEAHRNITGRSISASHGADCLVGSMSSSTNNTDMGLPFHDASLLSIEDSSSNHEKDTSQDMPASPASPSSVDILVDPESPEDTIDRIFDRKGTRSCSPAIATTPASSKEPYMLPMLRVSEGNISPRDVDDSHVPNRSSDSHLAMTVISTDTTVGRLYTQYQTHILNPLYANNSSPVPIIRHIVHPRNGAVNRLGFSTNDQGYSHPRTHQNLQSTPDGTPENSPRNPALLLTVPTRESLLYPKPLRVQSIRAEGKHTSLLSGTGASATGMTTDSEEDPFRYDKDTYNIFLHPSKERDVSAALNQISGLSSHSRATLCTDEDDLPVRRISLRPPQIPKEYFGEDPFAPGPTRARSPTPESADGFYDTSVIQPNWAAENSAYEVKVVLQDASRHPSIDNGRFSRVGGDGMGGGEKALRQSVFNPFKTSDLYHRKDKENMPSSERDDWETVATTAGGFGSMRLPLPAGGGLGGSPRGFRITGSSLADVSDDNSFRDVPFDEYASTDRIVQHPSGHEDSEESLQIHQISGTKVPVMVPKQRMHRVNGFPQNSLRVLPHSQRSGSEAAAALARKMSNPFRQRSGRCPHPFSPMPLQPLPFKLDKGKNRFEFRHHSRASDCDPLCEKGGAYEFHGVSSETGNATNDTRNGTLSDKVNATHGSSASLRDSGSSQSSRDTIHSFPFHLIPLPEAARLQAVERAANTDSSDTDPFWAGKAGNKRRPPIPTRIRVPERIHQRSTRINSNFAASSTQSSCKYNWLKRPQATKRSGMISTTTGGGTWATILPFGSTSTGYGGPSQMLRSAATRLHLDDLSRRFQYQRRADFSVGSGLSNLSNTPRLYPWDYQARRRRRTRGTDPELRAIALEESDGERRGRIHDLERNGVPLDPEAFISHEGRHRRQTWFYCMLAVSMFPFISVMVYLGKFDSGLSWYTRGEVDRLNSRQRRVILVVTVAQFVLWPLILGLVVWRTQQLATLG